MGRVRERPLGSKMGVARWLSKNVFLNRIALTKRFHTPPRAARPGGAEQCSPGRRCQRPAAFDSGLKPELDLTLIRGLNLKSEETYSTINLNQGTRRPRQAEAEKRKRKQNENLLPLFSLFLLSSFPEEKKKDTRTQ